jgi:hypothetical protein
MRIRDGHATLNDDKSEHEMPSNSLDIIADDGRRLFGISLNKDGSIRVDFGHVCKHGGAVLGDFGCIIPIASNCFTVKRDEYK